MDIVSRLRTNPHLRVLSPEELDALAFAFVERSFADGEIIIEQGQRANAGYIVLDGQVQGCRTHGDAEHHVVWLEPGAWFGLTALVDGEPRSATYRAVGVVRVGVLSVQAFSMLLNARAELPYAFQRALGYSLAADYRGAVGVSGAC